MGRQTLFMDGSIYQTELLQGRPELLGIFQMSNNLADFSNGRITLGLELRRVVEVRASLQSKEWYRSWLLGEELCA